MEACALNITMFSYRKLSPQKSEEDVMIKNEKYAQNNEALRERYCTGKYGGIRRDKES